jgi:hypothetical protein
MRNSEVEPLEKQAIQKSKSASRKFVVAPRSLGLIASNAVVFTDSSVMPHFGAKGIISVTLEPGERLHL